MTRVRRGGRELVVSDTDVTAYLNMGYAVIDDRGNEIETVRKEPNFAELKAENAALKARVKQLEDAINGKAKKAKKA